MRRQDSIRGNSGAGFPTTCQSGNLPHSLAEQHGVCLQDLGDLEALPDRICAEVAAANSVVSLIAIMSAWSCKASTADSSQGDPRAKQRN
jgi:hypothetical protein